MKLLDRLARWSPKTRTPLVYNNASSKRVKMLVSDEQKPRRIAENVSRSFFTEQIRDTFGLILRPPKRAAQTGSL